MNKSDVVRHFGSAAAIARLLNISEPAVSQWDEIIPKGRAYEIESMTGGELKVNQADYATPATPSEGSQAPARAQ